ncbi:putative glyoxalase/bleomycin resistance protein [Microlunatus endophyticus]|uniref:Glyoxalase/bleomycin resistance protein n=1 Tax=Microlunatus endophyticus TaxID=1716077 RepID=A0A917S3U3_9ACTN|nr:VOC family protein [Microlunatus endophyticus]GGL56533.1 putative glyoxalase/bleomycin resistance protein [Microlunatus endophyticus]
MIDHFGINVEDMAAASRFYDAVLGTLGHRRLMDFGQAVGYGTQQPQFWISTFDGVGANRENHIAFTAPDADHVRAFGEAARTFGVEILHEPRMWPEYHEHYYAVFVRDLEGNNVEAVCHTANEGD